VDLVGTLLQRLPRAGGALAWVADGDGLVGWGEAARIEVSGPDRFEQARDWWRAFVASCTVDDEVGVRGSGPVAFGSFSFAPTGTSVLVVPQVTLGRRAGTTWLSTVGDPPRLASPDPVHPPGELRYSHGQVSVTDFRESVARAVARLRAGELDKVVLAHDLVAAAEHDIDARFVLAGLAAANPGCWTYAVDGLVGATPELYVSREGDRVLSRVLAGTTSRGRDDVEDHDRVDAMLHSVKERSEHQYAVESLVDALSPHVRDLEAPAEPHALELSNVTHLATDVVASLNDGSDVLDLVAAVHPTAAVGGTPTDVALGVLGELEAMDRGRYAGPVGWVDARGDGEWGIALRCAEIDPAAPERLRLFAGCGIVAGSKPADELAESEAKLVPVRDALRS
jgi:menaquinone-specific isochorismate synthase